MSFRVYDRIEVLRRNIKDLAEDNRNSIKNSAMRSVEVASKLAYDKMVSMTPVREDEPEELFDYRVDRWKKLGVQDYIKHKSANRSYRLYGSNLKNGWRMPTLSYVGSSRNNIKINTSVSNIAEHAKMVLTDNYTKSQWDITNNNLYGGRKALAFMRGGNIVMVRKDSSSFPVKFRPGHSVAKLGIIEAGQNIMQSYKNNIINAVDNAIKEEVRNLF